VGTNIISQRKAGVMYHRGTLREVRQITTRMASTFGHDA
jgi:hypothetical protein